MNVLLLLLDLVIAGVLLWLTVSDSWLSIGAAAAAVGARAAVQVARRRV